MTDKHAQAVRILATTTRHKALLHEIAMLNPSAIINASKRLTDGLSYDSQPIALNTQLGESK